VTKGEKLLERMRANPRDDWRIEDVETLCRAYELDFRKPRGGSSHATISHSSQQEILTVVARKPIKPVYIHKRVAFIDNVLGSDS
jgi:hypothetical protein